MSCSKPKCQHVDQMLKEKLQILNKLECGMKTVDVCKTYNLSQSTLPTWRKQKSKLKDMVDAGKVLETNRNCKSFLWFGEMRSKPHTPSLNKQVLIEKGYVVSYFLTCLTCSTKFRNTTMCTVIHILRVSSTCSTYNNVYCNTYPNNQFYMFDM